MESSDILLKKTNSFVERFKVLLNKYYHIARETCFPPKSNVHIHEAELDVETTQAS